MFQSLFLWNSRPDVLVGDEIDIPAMFQSLFLWNSRPDGGGQGQFSASISFNPCFCGTRARTRAVLVDDGVRYLFQSLFLWNSRPDERLPW